VTGSPSRSRRLQEELERVRLGVEEMLAEQVALERRIAAVEQERRFAEWRIHTDTERMLDVILHELRAIADLFSRVR
jgi:uncharacterized protein YhaN